MRILNLIVLGAILAATCGVAPGSVSAQDETPVKSDLLLRVKGPVIISPVDTMGTVWVIGNNATILGTVRELVVIRGAARIEGTVQGNKVLINCTATRRIPDCRHIAGKRAVRLEWEPSFIGLGDAGTARVFPHRLSSSRPDAWAGNANPAIG